MIQDELAKGYHMRNRDQPDYLRPTELFKHLDETVDIGPTLPIEDGPKQIFDDDIAHGAYDHDRGTIKAPPKVMEADESEERPRVAYSELGDRNAYNDNSKFAFHLHPVGQFSNSELNLDSNDDFKRKKTVKFQDKGLDFPQDRHFNRTDGFVEPTIAPR